MNGNEKDYYQIPVSQSFNFFSHLPLYPSELQTFAFHLSSCSCLPSSADLVE